MPLTKHTASTLPILIIEAYTFNKHIRYMKPVNTIHNTNADMWLYGYSVTREVCTALGRDDVTQHLSWSNFIPFDVRSVDLEMDPATDGPLQNLLPKPEHKHTHTQTQAQIHVQQNIRHTILTQPQLGNTQRRRIG